MSNAIDRLAVMFAALTGIEQLGRRDGDAASHERRSHVCDVLAEQIRAGDGELVEIVGDELLAVFASPDAALNCACLLQKTVHRDDDVADPLLGLTVGLHFGVVYRKGERIFGDSVNTAARVKGQGQSGRILLSDAHREVLHAESQAIVSPFDRIEVKGKAEPLTLFEAVWAPEDLNRTSVMPSMIDTGYLKDLAAQSLHLWTAEGEREITSAMTPVTLGRGVQCDIALDCPTASRLHCRIEHRRGKFVLVDSSTNGTQLERSDGSRVVLKREQAVLTGRGRFALGRAPDADDAHSIAFATD